MIEIKKNFPSSKYLNNPIVMNELKNFEDPSIFQSDICKNCPKDMCCCNRGGCMYFTEDFEDFSFYSLRNNLEKGNISITSEIGIQDGICAPMYHLSAREENKDIVNLFSLPSKCSLVTEKGCPYTLEERPLGGIMLLPRMTNGILECDYPDEVLCIALNGWQQQAPVLKQLIEHFCNEKADIAFALQIKKFLLEIESKKFENFTRMERNLVKVAINCRFSDEIMRCLRR